jgi:endoglucanase
MRKLIICGLWLILLAGCRTRLEAKPTSTVHPTDPTPTATSHPMPTVPPSPTASPVPTTVSSVDIFERNQRLGRGVNLGDALEAPIEGEWGVIVQADYFRWMAEAGFDSVRLPIRWSAYAGDQEPFTIQPGFFERVDWAVNQALDNGLIVIVDFHHYLEMMSEPDGHRERFLALWRQVAEHYQDYPEEVYFEVLNEPNDALGGELWNEIAAEAIASIRDTNPTRPLILGPDGWNGVRQLRGLQLPEDDRNLIVTFHYYLPFEFTHQGADWVDGSDAWLGTTWTGTSSELGAIKADFDFAAAWGAQNDRPIYLGEFGAYSRAGMESRALWTATVARQAEMRGFSWGYWEFCSGFGVYDRMRRTWVEPLRLALLPGQ